jgi:ABC-type transport system substrate-binding protein
MNRRTALALLSTAAASPLALGAPLRALAQATATRTLTYGQSGAVTALDPAQGSFTTYPAGYEVAYCLYDRLVD